MKAFTLTTDLNVTAFASRKGAEASSGAVFTTVEQLDQILTASLIKPVDLWNSLPGLTPVKKFMDRKTGLARIWKQLQSLEVTPDAVEEPAAELEQRRTNMKASAASDRKKRREAKAAKAAAAKPAAKATNGAETAHEPREGSKGAQVAELLKRPEGAGLEEIMQATGWQKHTVRGFIAGAAKKKLGLTIESFKSDDGQRTYRVVA